MATVKFCRHAHNPALGATALKVASLQYYRHVSNDFIRDVDEPVIGRLYSPPTAQTITGDELGRMLGMSIGGNGLISFEGNAVSINVALPNAYIFCTSIRANPTIADAAALDYDSAYVITDVELFAKLAAEQVLSKVTAHDVVFSHGPVIYRDEKIYAVDDLQQFVNEHRSVGFTPFFLKRRTSSEDPSKVYETEREYRFVFIPVDNRSRSIDLQNHELFLAVTDSIRALLSNVT